MSKDLSLIIDTAVKQWEEQTDQIIMVAQGERDGRDCIVVEVKCDTKDVSGIIPKTFEGYDVIVTQGPEITAGG